MEQVTGNRKYDAAGDRLELRRGWAGLEAVDIAGFADMKKPGLDGTKLGSAHGYFVLIQRPSDN